jgi:hypothetical protein
MVVMLRCVLPICILLGISFLSILEGTLEVPKNCTTALASLTFHVKEWKEQIESANQIEEDEIIFLDTDVKSLWKEIELLLPYQPILEQDKYMFLFQEAFQAYYQAKSLFSSHKEEALHLLSNVAHILDKLWRKSIQLKELSINPPDNSFLFSELNTTEMISIEQQSNDIRLPEKIRKRIQPHLISTRHPLKQQLDFLFSSRITNNVKRFHEAGFKTIAKQPRSFIRVAKHPLLPDHLIKVYLDTVVKKKRNRESWEWLSLRCEGANKIRAILKKYRIKHFSVPYKCLYCVPSDHSPASKRHPVLLLVTDMKLVPSASNYHAWKNLVTKEHLDELYLIISHSKGSSYRPDNIAYTEEGKFAFIDTEYEALQLGPDYKKIRKHLSSSMLRYWDSLVKGK